MILERLLMSPPHEEVPHAIFSRRNEWAPTECPGGRRVRVVRNKVWFFIRVVFPVGEIRQA